MKLSAIFLRLKHYLSTQGSGWHQHAIAQHLHRPSLPGLLLCWPKLLLSKLYDPSNVPQGRSWNQQLGAPSCWTGGSWKTLTASPETLAYNPRHILQLLYCPGLPPVRGWGGDDLTFVSLSFPSAWMM